MTGAWPTAIPTITQAAAALRAGEIKPVELVRDCLARLDPWEPHIKALTVRLDEQALAAAEAATRELASGLDRGPLHGVPLVVKDVIDVAGVPTAAGSQVLDDVPARADAPVVGRLRAAGAVIVAKSNTHEFAYGALTPPTRNPWDTARMPGGSSGGTAAAVAAGAVPAGLGTDTAGSVREPAALCGVVGLKPTFGRVSCRGVVPLAWSLDTVGPLARTVEDCALLLAATAGPDPAYPSSATRTAPLPDGRAPEVGNLQVAVVRELMDPLQEPVRAALHGILDRLSDAGARLTEVAIGDVDELVATAFVILGAESLSYHRPLLADRRERYGEDVLAYLELAASYSGADYVDAQRVRTVFRQRVDAVLDEADVLLAPAQHVVAPKVSDALAVFEDGRTRPRDLTLIRPLVPFSFTGHPAVSLPVGRDLATGLPVGVQLVGRAFRDEELLALAAPVQALGAWDGAVPVLPT